jgi:hypothetical protein
MARRRKRRRPPRRVDLGSVSAQDFDAVASTLCKFKAPEGIAEDLAAHFAKKNPRFSRTRFLEATRKC